MARNRTRAQRSEDKRQSLTSCYVAAFNDYENRREREFSHGATLFNPLIQEKRKYFATMKLLGFLFWWKISNHYVELSYYTEIGTTMTAVVMKHCIVGRS